MRNKYLRCARVLERDFRAVLSCFAYDLPAWTAAKICGDNKQTAHRLNGLLRQHVVALAQTEAKPFVGGIVEIDERYFGPRRVRASAASADVLWAGKFPSSGCSNGRAKASFRSCPTAQKSSL